MVLNREDAKRLAFEFISSTHHEPDDELVIIDDVTIEREYGWVFFYQSGKFLRTQNISDALAGNGPVLVERNAGTVVPFGTAHDAEYYIDKYERGEWK